MPTLTRSTAHLVAGLLALALTAGLVIRTSSAVFTSSTENRDNSLEAGTIVLTDDDGGSIALTMENIAPGEFSQECIRVEYGGSLDPEAVRVHSTSSLTESVAGMAGQVLLTIEQGDGTSAATTDFGTCAGFSGTTIVDDVPVSTWNSTATDYASGAGTWDPGLGPGQSRAYRITLELALATDNTYQGATLDGINLTWATRSTSTPGLVP